MCLWRVPLLPYFTPGVEPNIGHFRVPLCLSFKASVKPFLWKWLWFAWKLNCMQNSFSYEMFPNKRTRKWPNPTLVHEDQIVHSLTAGHILVSSYMTYQLLAVGWNLETSGEFETLQARKRLLWQKYALTS